MKLVVAFGFKKVEDILFSRAELTFHLGHCTERLFRIVKLVTYFCNSEIHLLLAKFSVNLCYSLV